MPITKSAKKALQQSIRRRVRNLKKKEAYKKAVKETRNLALAVKISEANSTLSAAYKALDKAAKTNVIAKNKAARLKSRLAKLIRLRASKA